MTSGRAGISTQEFEFLRSGDADLCAWGEIDWAVCHTTWRGDLALACGVDGWFGPTDLVFQLNVRPMRPSEPTAILLARQEAVMRVDVNGGHRGKKFTHVQFRQQPEAHEPPDWFRSPPLGDTVSGDTYHQVYVDAARLFNIDVSGADWTEPPIGGAI